MISILKKYKPQINYLIFGVLTTVVNAVIAFPLYKAMNHHIANTAAWCGAVIFAYTVNKIFVFKSKRRGVKAVTAEFGAFVGSRVLSYLFELGIFAIAVDIMDFDKAITKIASAVIVVITNYFLGKLIFQKRKADKA